MLLKTCSKCGKQKSLTAFYRDKRASDCCMSRCKDCFNDYQRGDMGQQTRKKWKRTESGKFSTKQSYLKQKFGISFDEYNLLLAKQNGVCAICGQIETALSSRNVVIKCLAVDHNHETGEVRGLVCMACNLILGNAKDNTETLKNAIEYLESNS